MRWRQDPSEISLEVARDQTLGLVGKPLVHPGYFFDFATDGFLVFSLLPEPIDFTEGVRRLAAYLGELIAPAG